MKRYIVLVLLGLAGCSPATLKDYSDRLQGSLTALQKQQETSSVDWEKANASKEEAFKQPEFKFQNPKTQVFIERWKDAESSVVALRQKHKAVVKSAEELFVVSYKKCDSIKDSALKNKLRPLIAEQEKKFHAKVSEAGGQIAVVEARIEKGNDIIKALEIVGTLQVIHDLGAPDISLPSLHDTIGELCKEGETLLKFELSALK